MRVVSQMFRVAACLQRYTAMVVQQHETSPTCEGCRFYWWNETRKERGKETERCDDKNATTSKGKASPSVLIKHFKNTIWTFICIRSLVVAYLFLLSFHVSFFLFLPPSLSSSLESKTYPQVKNTCHLRQVSFICGKERHNATEIVS